MKKVIKSAVYIKNIMIWTVISFCCIVAIVTFAKKSFENLSGEDEIFWPGISILGLAIFGLLFFSITRIVKYIKRIKQNN
jgi:hypothetical protein